MKILIADDEAIMRECLTTMLTNAGHEVVQTTDGVEALRAYRNGEFDLVITDYQMPRKNGVVLIMDIRGIDKEQPVILVSGDPPTLTSITKDITGEFPMLQKPYRSAQILALVEAETTQKQL